MKPKSNGSWKKLQSLRKVWPVRRHRAEEGLDSVLIAGHRKVSLIIIQWNHPLLVLDHLIGKNQLWKPESTRIRTVHSNYKSPFVADATFSNQACKKICEQRRWRMTIDGYMGLILREQLNNTLCPNIHHQMETDENCTAMRWNCKNDVTYGQSMTSGDWYLQSS